MVLWQLELKRYREMGTHPGRVTLYVQTWYSNPKGQGAQTMGFWGPSIPNHVVCPGLDVPAGLDLAAGWSFAQGCWGFAGGLLGAAGALQRVTGFFAAGCWGFAAGYRVFCCRLLGLCSRC